MSKTADIVGSFGHLDLFITAVEDAKKNNIEVVDVFTPVPVKEVEAILSPKTSPVRFLTGGGAVAGLVGGFALAIWSSLIWNIFVGGKPIANHVPFVVVGFEALILLGALSTFLAILLFAKLPNRKFPGPAYRPEFSNDQFGIWLNCPSDKAEKTSKFLEDAGAQNVEQLQSKEGRVEL